MKEIQKFLGLANYYRQFIKDFARITALLHQLVRKEEQVEMGERTSRSI